VTVNNRDYNVAGRAKRIIGFLLENQNRINADTKGTLELNWRDRLLSGKLVSGFDEIE
jgi:hypothetical protein